MCEGGTVWELSVGAELKEVPKISAVEDDRQQVCIMVSSNAHSPVHGIYYTPGRGKIVPRNLI